MAWTATVVLVSYTVTKEYPEGTPDHLKNPPKTRGEVAYVFASTPNVSGGSGSGVCPYVFLEVTGVPDNVTLAKIQEQLRRIHDELIDLPDGSKAWKTYNRHNAKIDFTLLPAAAQTALQTPGGVATVTVNQFLAACNLRIQGRKAITNDFV